MKQILFLLLLPCFAMAQYQGNANQKITLGEQTTADGLVYRGVENDTALITPRSDTSAYIILDTVSNRFFHYKRNTNVWSVAGGSDTSLIAYVNTYGAQTVNGAKTFTSAVTATRFNPTASTATGTGMFLPSANTLGFSTNGVNKMTLDANGNLGIGVTTLSARLSVKSIESAARAITILGRSDDIGTIRFFNTTGTSEQGSIISTATSFGFMYNDVARLSFAASTGAATFSSSVTATTGIFTNYAGGGLNGASLDNIGQIVRTSSIVLKKDVTPIRYGLQEILNIQPVNYNWINEDRFGDNNENGFVAEDVMSIIPNTVGSDANGIFMDYTKLIPILTKAIQEQQALIKALEQRILNLENK